MNVLILGVNGFIGNALTRRILTTTDWQVFGMDLANGKLDHSLGHPRFHFLEGDIGINREWIEFHVSKCDVVLPLVAIATPATYVKDPLRVFELDFEQNLRIVRDCVKYGKRVVFPSTSEVYGMCPDAEFDEDASPLVYGPINKPRWIYACSKQLLDRVIAAYGQQQGLSYTCFRPFNWIGPRLDDVYAAKEGSSRVLTQFIVDLIEGQPIQLVDGGSQKRCFTWLEDGLDGLMAIIENRGGVCDGEIFNLGNPDNECSIRELAERLMAIYQDAPRRRPRLRAAADGRGERRQLLRRRLPGHRQPQAVDRQGAQAPRLGAQDDARRRHPAHLRRLPRRLGEGAFGGADRRVAAGRRTVHPVAVAGVAAGPRSLECRTSNPTPRTTDRRRRPAGRWGSGSTSTPTTACATACRGCSTSSPPPGCAPPSTSRWAPTTPGAPSSISSAPASSPRCGAPGRPASTACAPSSPAPCCRRGRSPSPSPRSPAERGTRATRPASTPGTTAPGRTGY